jgi:hypothetical protein
MYINVLLNWEESTMKLRSSFVLKSEWFSNMPTCVAAMNHKIQAQDAILLYKQARVGWRGTASHCGDYV